jgi:hypothetical protein
MRMWNLTEPSLFDDVVVENLAESKRVRPRVARGSQFQAVKAIAGVASIAFTISFSNLFVNQGCVRLPNWNTAIARSAPDLRPPLQGVFGNRFNSDWTKDVENSLLNEIVERRLASGPLPDRTGLFIYSNQQEDITLESPRLTLDSISKIARRQKIS